MVIYFELKLIILIFIYLLKLLQAFQSVHYGFNQTVIVNITHLKTDEDMITVMPVKEARINKKIIAKAILNITYDKTGWDILEVWTNSKVDDESQAYWGGYAEGCLTTSVISKHWYNTRSSYCTNKKKWCKKIEDFITENIKWINLEIKSKKLISNYWWLINLFYLQLKGLHEGYMKCKKPNDYDISYLEFLLLNSDAELSDIAKSFTKKKHNLKRGKKLSHHELTTAIITLLPDNKELYIGHATFNTYNYMNRMLKNYIFQYHLTTLKTEKIPGERITFSGYPGAIHSQDDFYTISSGLTVEQTSIPHLNYTSYIFIKPTGKVLVNARVMVANRLAETAEKWSKSFSKLNSGTYNNQWMIIDYNKFTKGKSPEPGLLWILEQLPGYVKAEDETSALIKQKYWSGVNIPYFNRTFQLSDYNAQIKKYGDWFIYEKNSRAKIIKRDYIKVKDMQTFMNLMRYNDYKNDPLSKCSCEEGYSASNAISVRNDLNYVNGTYPFNLLTHQAAGSYDAKIIDSELIKTQQFMAVSGPTTGTNLKPFKWSINKFSKKYRHMGQPNEWNFTPILTNWSLTSPS